MKNILKVLTGLIIGLSLPLIASATIVPRTIVNPAANSTLSSSVLRNELQTLENEIASYVNGVLTTPNTFTQLQTFSANASTTLISAVSGYFNSIAATSTTATSSVANLGGILDASSFTGSDIGARANAAYSSSPAYGAEISVDAPAAGTAEWDFTTPILFTTANKPALLNCSIGGGANNNIGGFYNGNTLLWTATTGTTTSFRNNASINANGAGIYGCNIQGTNGTTARNDEGVYFGDFGGSTTGSFNAYLDKVNLNGFGTGVSFHGSTSFNSILNSTIHFNGVNVSEPDTSGANCENMRIIDSVLADANWQGGGGHATAYRGMYVQESGNCQWTIAETSLDDNQTYIDQFGGTSNVWNFMADHQEDPNKTIYPMIQGNPNTTAGNVNTVTNLIGGDMMNDVVLGQPDQIEESGYINLLGFTSDGNGGNTGNVTRIINATASSTYITWAGLQCQGANKNSFVYGNVLCSPMGVGSDYGQPSFYVASTTTSGGIGIVDFATSTTNFSVAKPAVVNIGPNPLTTNATSTINMKRLQFQGENAAGTVSCAYVVGTAWVIQAGGCNN